MLVCVILLIATTLADLITTALALNKHQNINIETNPFVVLGVPMWVLTLILIIGTAVLSWIYLRSYHRYNVFVRYFLTYVLVFMILLKFSVAVSNYGYYKLPTEDLIPIPEENRIDTHIDEIGNMKVTQSIAPEQAKNIPLALTMFIWNFIVFALWYDFEKGIK